MLGTAMVRFDLSAGIVFPVEAHFLFSFLRVVVFFLVVYLSSICQVHPLPVSPPTPKHNGGVGRWRRVVHKWVDWVGPLCIGILNKNHPLKASRCPTTTGPLDPRVPEVPVIRALAVNKCLVKDVIKLC